MNKFGLSLMVIFLWASGSTVAEPACNANGEYGQFADTTQRRLAIDGTRAVLRIVESKGANDRLDDKKLKLLSRDEYKIASTPMQHNLIGFDLLDAYGKTAYLGFIYDCETRSLEHASLGEFRRISSSHTHKTYSR